MLADKVRQEDSLGHYGPGQYAIIAPGTSPTQFTKFAERVREAVEVAKVPVQGQPVSLTVSVGVACVPPESEPSALGLLELAVERMNEAMGLAATGLSPVKEVRRHHASSGCKGLGSPWGTS
ncbi:MAG: diguanylate cyclase [Dechloromonas sp.]|nr:MAG: diguanylate cyclase [Dechloromonas sp.]